MMNRNFLETKTLSEQHWTITPEEFLNLQWYFYAINKYLPDSSPANVQACSQARDVDPSATYLMTTTNAFIFQ